MPKLPGSEVNPYAPPQAEVLGLESLSLQALHRPKSTKWALFVLFLKVGMVSWLFWTMIQEQRLTEFWNSYLDAPIASLSFVSSLIGLILLMVTNRSRVAYAFTSLALLLLCSDGVWNGYHEWIKRGVFLPPLEALFEVGGYLAFMSAIFYLSYCFIQQSQPQLLPGWLNISPTER